MMTRGENTLAKYSRNIRVAWAWEEAQKTIKDDLDRYAATQKLIADERSTLKSLEESLRTKQQVPGSMDDLLKTMFGEDILREQTAKNEAAAASASAQKRADAANPALTVPQKLQDAILAYSRNKTPALYNALTAAAVEAVRNKSLPQEKVNTIIGQLPAPPGQGMPSAASKAQQAAADVLDRAVMAPATGGGTTIKSTLTPTEEKLKNAQAQAALEQLGQQGEFGYFGGSTGAAKAALRESEPAPEGSGFKTEQDALQAYLAAIGDGTATKEEFGDRDLAFAKKVYDRAKEEGSYQNKDKRLFNDTYLSQAKRVSSLEAEAQKGPGFDDPMVEAARRSLKLQGVNVDDPFVQYKGTYLYEILPGAAKLSDEVIAEMQKDPSFKLTPATKAQQAAQSMLDGGADPSRIRQQLAKGNPPEFVKEAMEYIAAREIIQKEKATTDKPQTQRQKQEEFKKQQMMIRKEAEALRAEREAETNSRVAPPPVSSREELIRRMQNPLTADETMSIAPTREDAVLAAGSSALPSIAEPQASSREELIRRMSPTPPVLGTIETTTEEQAGFVDTTDPAKTEYIQNRDGTYTVAPGFEGAGTVINNPKGIAALNKVFGVGAPAPTRKSTPRPPIGGPAAPAAPAAPRVLEVPEVSFPAPAAPVTPAPAPAGSGKTAQRIATLRQIQALRAKMAAAGATSPEDQAALDSLNERLIKLDE